MISTQHDFVASQYGPRAVDYVSSPTHANGADLDQIEALLRGRPPALPHDESRALPRDKPHGRVLDLGCGGGHVSYRASPYAAEVVACDVTAEMLAAVQHTARSRGMLNIAVRLAAAEALPFEAATFDVVLCRFSAHHWQDLEAGLREARRVLKPDGVAAFIDTVAPASPLLDSHLQAIELLRDASHVRNYTVAEWIAALSRSRWQSRALTMRRLVMEFESWTARTATQALHIQAIRSIQLAAPPSVRAYFEIVADGSFSLDTMSVIAGPA